MATGHTGCTINHDRNRITTIRVEGQTRLELFPVVTDLYLYKSGKLIPAVEVIITANKGCFSYKKL